MKCGTIALEKKWFAVLRSHVNMRFWIYYDNWNGLCFVYFYSTKPHIESPGYQIIPRHVSYIFHNFIKKRDFAMLKTTSGCSVKNGRNFFISLAIFLVVVLRCIQCPRVQFSKKSQIFKHSSSSFCAFMAFKFLTTSSRLRLYGRTLTTSTLNLIYIFYAIKNPKKMFSTEHMGTSSINHRKANGSRQAATQ